MRSSRPAQLAAWLALAAALAGCPRTSRVVVEAPADVNGGRSVYVLLRAVDEATFDADSYGVTAAKVVKRDDSVLEAAPIYPGTRRSFEAVLPKEKALGVYVFFTHPVGEGWRRLVRAPVPKKIVIELEADRIKE